jgi:hypothetical protein
MTPRRIRWFLSLQDVLLTTTAHIAKSTFLFPKHVRVASILGFIPVPHAVRWHCLCICIFSWSRRTSIRPPRVALSFVAFTRLLVRAFWIDTTRRYYSWKGPSDPPSYGLMIVWALGRRVSESCTWSYMNWKAGDWSSSTAGDIAFGTRHHPVFMFADAILFMINVARSSLHHITSDVVSCFMEDTLQKSSNIFTWFFITSPGTSSPTIHPSVYIFMVHHDWRSVIFSLFFKNENVLTTLRCHSGGQRIYGSSEWKNN